MNLKNNITTIILFLFLIPNAKSAETISLYKGMFSRRIKIEELNQFQESKITSSKLKNLLTITNLNEKNLFKILSYEIEIPIKTSSKLMNSKIGKVFLSRVSKIIYPNKISNKNIGIKAIRSGIILSAYKNNQKINLVDFFNEYPNKNIAINLNSLNQALKKTESLKELIKFYSDSPFKKLKDGRSNT